MYACVCLKRYLIGGKFMRWIENLQVAYKLLILCFVAALGMAIIGYSGYSALQESKEGMNIMTSRHGKSLYYLGNCRHAMRYMQGMMLIATSANDPERVKAVKGKYQTGKQEMITNLEKFDEIAKEHPNMNEIYGKVRKDWNSYQAALDKAMELVDNGQPAEGRDYYDTHGAKVATSLGAAFVELLKIADQEDEAINQRNEQLNIQNTEKADATSRNMIIQSVIFLLLLVGVALLITREITSPLNSMMEACARLRDGDFRDMPRSAGSIRGDEFGHMADIIVAMRTTINNLMRNTNANAQQLASAAEELTASATQSAHASSMVASSVASAAGAVAEQQRHVSDTMESVDNTIATMQQISDTANAVADEAKSSQEDAVQGTAAIEVAIDKIQGVEKIVNHSATTVDKLGKSSQEIGQIVETISGIAEQTNLLALNAAIEAARAGEHGLGFAVVADEVRKLAEGSHAAAQRITDLISVIQADTTEAVRTMQEGSSAVREGTSYVEELRETFEQIRVASGDVAVRIHNMTQDMQGISAEASNIKQKSEQISSNSGKVSGEMENVATASDEQSTAADEIATASKSLAKLAQDLQNSLNKFQF